MMHTPLPLTQDLVLIGGGHTHALVLRRWGMRPVPGVRLTLITPEPTAPYTGMLPGHVAGHYRREDLDIDLVRLARFSGVRLVLGRAEGIDRAAQTVAIPGRRHIRYDLLSLDIGATSEMAEVPGFAEFGVAAKPLGPFAARWARFADNGGPVAVIGGGVAAVELALAMRHRLGKTPSVAVIADGPILNGLPTAAARRLRAEMARQGITLHEYVRVVEVTAVGVVLDSGTIVPASMVVGAAGARPHAWLVHTGLALQDGFVAVDAQLRAVDDPNIYAVGDCAHLSHAPRPKAGVYAVRAAPTLYHNLRAQLTGRQRQAFWPQRDFLKLISLGDRRAIGLRSGVHLQGAWVWAWKDQIDRKFMRQLTDLRPMPTPRAPSNAALGVTQAAGAQPICAGCGSKLGGLELTQALLALPRPTRTDVTPTPADDAAVLSIGGARQVISVDHLRAFTPDPWLLGRVAANHALGDVLAMGAEPQAALASIIVPPMHPKIQADAVAEIMAAAAEVFNAVAADIVGGHTTQGAEMTVGFTVTGLAARAPILLSGMRAGDALVLTKPIGSGTILAGEMALKARGAWVTTLWAAMGQSQAEAARILRDAHAMTDVTGFGLAGHLAGMLRASGVGAELRLNAVPVFDGALKLAAVGIRSTLYAANRAAVEIEGADGPRAALMFDPQTAGGLLAAIDAAKAERVIAALQNAGYTAAVIGMAVEGPPKIRLIDAD